jgi:hypothetical protein
MLSSALVTLIVKYGTEVVAGGIILAVRYLEKKSLIKKYKKTKEEILRYK